jgi:hypothetical protein
VPVTLVSSRLLRRFAPRNDTGKLAIALALLSLTVAACGVVGTSRDLTAAQKFIAEIKLESDLTLVGWVDHKNRSYDTGEKMIFSVWVNRDAYVAVLRVLRSGKTTVLFPNKVQPKALIAAGTTVQIPDPGDKYEIVAGKDGPELIEFLASTDGNSWLFTRKPAGSATFVELGATTKELAKDIPAALRGKAAAKPEGKADGKSEEKAEDKSESGGRALAASQSLIIAID